VAESRWGRNLKDQIGHRGQLGQNQRLEWQAQEEDQMSAGDQAGSDGPLSREQVLDELEFLATVEHALIVECLSVHCALGHDLPADQGRARCST
jgi:hypothetical protein